MGFSHMSASRHGSAWDNKLLHAATCWLFHVLTAKCPQRLRALAYIDQHRLHAFLKHSAWLLLAFAKLPAPQRLSGAFAEEAGCPDDVCTTIQTSCRRCQEVYFLVQILIKTKIWTQTFCPLPKVWKRREAFRNDEDSARNLSRICGEVAEWMRIY